MTPVAHRTRCVCGCNVSVHDAGRGPCGLCACPAFESCDPTPKLTKGQWAALEVLAKNVDVRVMGGRLSQGPPTVFVPRVNMCAVENLETAGYATIRWAARTKYTGESLANITDAGREALA